MSTIDRAFVKAFAKEKRSLAAPAAAAGANGHSDDVTAVWIDPVNDHYLRLDATQAGAGPHPSRPRGGQPASPRTPLVGQGGTGAVVGRPGTDASDVTTDQRDGERSWHHQQATIAASEEQGVASPQWDAQLFAPIMIESQRFAEVLPADAAETAGESAVQAAEAPLQPAATAEAATDAPAAEESAEPAEAPAFEAAWEVDRFEVPELVVQLIAAGGLLTSAGVPLADACREGLKSLLVTSPGRGEGKTSVAMGLALTVAARGLRVALLDGDCRSAALADRFRLDIQYGWAEAVRGGWALEETAVHSLEDSLTLLPLVPAADGRGIAAEELGRAIADLQVHFDLVIVDAGSSDDGWPSDLPRRAIDAALVIRDVRVPDPESLAICLETLRGAGITSLGLADNFAS